MTSEPRPTGPPPTPPHLRLPQPTSCGCRPPPGTQPWPERWRAGARAAADSSRAKASAPNAGGAGLRGRATSSSATPCSPATRLLRTPSTGGRAAERAAPGSTGVSALPDTDRAEADFQLNRLRCEVPLLVESVVQGPAAADAAAAWRRVPERQRRHVRPTTGSPIRATGSPPTSRVTKRHRPAEDPILTWIGNQSRLRELVLPRLAGTASVTLTLDELRVPDSMRWANPYYDSDLQHRGGEPRGRHRRERLRDGFQAHRRLGHLREDGGRLEPALVLRAASRGIHLDGPGRDRLLPRKLGRLAPGVARRSE